MLLLISGAHTGHRRMKARSAETPDPLDVAQAHALSRLRRSPLKRVSVIFVIAYIIDGWQEQDPKASSRTRR